MTTQAMVQQKVNTINPIIQGAEDLMKVRIAMGNRIAAGFAARHGMLSSAVKEEDKAEVEAMYSTILADLKLEYQRMTDAVVDKHADAVAERHINGDADTPGKLPSFKKFKPTVLISSYAELTLIDNYIRLLENERITNKQLESALKEYPIYTKYLEDIAGIGPKMAGVIISELDPHLAKYPSSFWTYSGLDTVIIGEYTNNAGVVVRISPAEINNFYVDKTGNEQMIHDGYPVTFVTVGRSRKTYCQRDVHYIDRDGKEATRKGITFNPFLKTKLIGVLGGAFLKVSVTTVNGEKMSSTDRFKLAVEKGFVVGSNALAAKKEVDGWLNANGFSVTKNYGRFGKFYYDYKHRLMHSQKPEHQGLNPAQIHARSIRYMVKEFLRELHIVWRHLEGLPNYEAYETAKLGYDHKRNDFIFQKFGIDSRKFISEAPLATEEPSRPKSIYPAAVQAYIDARSKPMMQMAA